MMKLYFHPLSHNSRRARSVALNTGVAFEPIVVDVMTGAHKKPEFLKINPNGMIPVLDDDNFILSESTAIDAQLANNDFITGKTVTLADFVCASPLTMAVPARIPTEKYKNIARWLTKMDTVPGWKESAPPPMS